MTSFKSVFDKLIGRIGGGQGRSPFNSECTDNPEIETELSVVSRPVQEMTTTFYNEFPPPSPPCTPVERMVTPDQDEILFRKNNVFLSYPKPVAKTNESSSRLQHRPRLDRTPSPLSLTSSDNSNSSSGSFQDNQVLIPGYLFVTTRGSNYGTTLILNWAPNSSMMARSSVSQSPPSPLFMEPGNSSSSSLTPKAANGDQSATGVRVNEEIPQLVNGEISENVTHTEYADGDAIVVTTYNRDREIPPWPGRARAVRTTERSDACSPPPSTRGGEIGGKEQGGREDAGNRAGSGEEGPLVSSYSRPSCSSVSIDLGVMEMIRIFYNTDQNGFIVSGEMVIRSKDRNFKVFRFKTGGLNDLVHILRSWKYFKHTWHKESHQHTFTVFQPKLSLAELHPQEGTVKSMLTAKMWKELMDDQGRVIDKDLVLKVVFFQGVDPPLRKEVWPFLLGLYSFDSSERERARVKSKKLEEYWSINKHRRDLEKEAAALAAAASSVVKTTGEVTRQTSSTSLSPPSANGSLRNSSETSYSSLSGSSEKKGRGRQQAGKTGQTREFPEVDIKSLTRQIEKDTVRTDRSHPYYKGENNINVKTLLNILLNYMIYNTDISYSQGMTDLLAPLLAALDDEAEAFWCFTKLVQLSIFYKPVERHKNASPPTRGKHSSPVKAQTGSSKSSKSHISIKHLLEPLRLLIQLLIPSFYSYLESIEEGLTLMFSHRWLLVCLKREFPDEDALHVWEACWTNRDTNSFHLFICIAIMAIYGQRAMDRNMNINELMVFFSSLSQSMHRDTVMIQARGYLHRFSQSPRVSCKLYPIMTEEFWERKGTPKLVCEDCNGLVDCPRTGFVAKKGAVC